MIKIKRTIDKSYLLAWLWAILVALAISVIAYQIRQSQNNTMAQILKGQSERTKSQIIYKAQELTDDLNAMVNRWMVDQGTPEYKWRSDARNFIDRIIGVNEIWWIDANQQVIWSESLGQLHHIEIKKILQQPRMQEELKQARRDNKPEYSPILTTDDGQNIILIFMPIQNADYFGGYFAIEIYLKPFIDRILDDPINTGFYTKAYADKAVAYKNGPELTQDSHLMFFEMNMDADDASWLFKVYPTETVLYTILSPLPYVVFIGGIILGLLFLMVLLSRRRAKRQSLQLSLEIEQKERVQEKLSYLANHDALTHLPNRHYLTQFIEQHINADKNLKKPFSLLFIDLDHFKDINDTLGHAIGDELLKKLPKLFSYNFRKNDIVARMGGDEFIVLMPGSKDEADISYLVDRFLQQLKYPFEIEGHQIRLTGSIGVALYPRDGTSVNELLSNADAALYRAKDKGRNTFAIYDSVIEHKAQARLKLVNQLHEAQEQNRFVMFYQPKFDRTGRLIGAEALIRWHQEQNYFRKPKEFLELLEDTGLIVSVSWQLLDLTCRQFKELLNLDKNLTLSFNVSAKLLEHPEFLHQLKSILDKRQFPYNRLELELTEQTLILDVENSQTILSQLKDWGVNIAIDDFGTGYSSLSYLKNFSVNTLKIDKSFIRDMNEDKDDLELVKTMLLMGQNLHITTVAEGVETVEQLQQLITLQCDQFQGYLLSYPLSFTDFRAQFERLRKIDFSDLTVTS